MALIDQRIGMRNFWNMIMVVGLASWMLLPAQAAEFKLNNGEVFKGRAAGPNEDGLIIALDVGGFSERIPWARFSQETLRVLAADAKIKPHVEPFIEIPMEIKIKRAAREREKNQYTLRYEPKVSRPEGITGFFSGLTSPFGLLLLGLIYLANLFAAWEIALFRRRSAGIVCGASAILPVLGPLLFLGLPAPGARAEAEAAPAVIEDTSTGGTGAPVPGGGSLSISRPKSSGTTALQPATYRRGEVTMNRRFFETKFPGFFRVVLGEAEKDCVIVFRTNRDEHIARRIARITANDLHIQVITGQEVSMSFDEIREVQLREKQGNE
jgi:hypothetical protein